LESHGRRFRWPSVTKPFVRDRVSFRDLRLAARFLRRVPSHLRRPLTVDHATTMVRERLARREAAFLELVTRTVYADPRSPYRRLLELAGCARGDLEQLVRAEGVEGALHVLFRQGVYLTIDEFKGRRAARRGSSTVEVDAARLRNPLSAAHVPTQSGGSGGTASPLVYDLASIRDQAANTLLALEAQGGRDWVKAIWGVSTGSAPVVLRFGTFGRPVARWFVHVNPAAPGIHPRYRWIPGGLRLAAAAAGVGFPRPEVVSLAAPPLAIARWVVETRRRGGTPHLYGFTSPVVRLCEAALAAGLDFAGARFTVTGEPVTAARLAAIRASGAEATLDYGCAEAGGPVSYGCLRPTAADEVHFCDDLHALIQPGPGLPHPAAPARAVLLSSLRMSAPVILLNVSLGDRAHVTRRRCGCPLEAHGWDTHLDTIRSFEKLTAGGMTFLDVDIAAVLEADLPARFGGGPADYQLLEVEREDGGAGVVLRVHPRVGPLDEGVVRDAFLDAIGAGAGAERIMAAYWRAAGVPGIQRKPPLLSEKGKLLHVWRSRTAAAGHAAAREVVG
jgi:hypothetical protein